MFLQSANGGILLRKCPRLHIEFAILVKKCLQPHIKSVIFVKKYLQPHIKSVILVKKCPLLHVEIGIFSFKFLLKKLLGDVNCFAIPVGEDISSFRLISQCPLYEFVIK